MKESGHFRIDPVEVFEERLMNFTMELVREIGSCPIREVVIDSKLFDQIVETCKARTRWKDPDFRFPLNIVIQTPAGSIKIRKEYEESTQ